jgi:mannose-6-phosphate isomerase-like protein (cupin superfamily)
MRGPAVIPPGGGEVIGDSPDRRVEVLSDAGSLHATWSRFGPRRDGADLHIHRRHTDLFYVLAGEMTVRLGAGGAPVRVPAGTLARVPPLVVHGFRNDGEAELRYLNFHAPGVGFADYLRALRDGREFAYDQEDPPADGGRSPEDAVIGGTGFATDRSGLHVALLADVDAIGVAEVHGEPAEPALAPHVHRRHVESFFVLEGELAVLAGDREVHAPEGSWVQIAPGVVHTLAVRGTGRARFLSVHTPSCGFGTFLRALDSARDEAEEAAARAAFDQQPAP